MPPYIGAHKAPIIGESLCCDGAGSPLALVGISPRSKVDDSKYGKFISLRGCRRLPSVGGLLCLPLECRALSLDYLARKRGKRRRQAG